MQRRRLGKSGLVVSEICLGTMTFGKQANETEAFRIMDHAFENGINFLDAAELYPVPPSADAVGDLPNALARPWHAIRRNDVCAD